MEKRFGSAAMVLGLAVGLAACGEDAAPIVVKEDKCVTQNEVAGAVAIVRIPFTVTVDGKLDDAAWSDSSVRWNKMGGADTLQPPPAVGAIDLVPDSDADLSTEWAVVADNDYLYVAIRTTDDATYTKFVGTSRSKQDSFSFLFDLKANSTGATLDDNDGYFVVGLDGYTKPNAEDPWIAPLVTAGATQVRPGFVLTAPAQFTGTSWTTEIAVSLKAPTATVVPEEGTMIRSTLQINDGDNHLDSNNVLIERETRLVSNIAARAELSLATTPTNYGTFYFCQAPSN